MAGPVCRVCGLQNIDGARFCAGCAAGLGAEGSGAAGSGTAGSGAAASGGLGFRTGPSAGAALRAGDRATDRSGQVLGGGRYRLERLLGAGGMGEVYEAWDGRFGLRVALKILAAHLMGSAQVHERMLNEARAMARINHPNVVRVFDVFEAEGGELVLVLELVTGGDLSDRVAAGGLSWPRIRSLMGGILAGLTAIHEAGLVHRDVKPANVLLGVGDVAKVTDLGVAREVDGRHQTATGLAIGTVGYMSPEQVRGQRVDFRSDLYSAGVVLFELLTGQLPFEATSDFDLQVAHVQQEPRWSLLPDLPGLQGLLRRSLAKGPEARWSSAAEMSAALAQLGRPTAKTAATPVLAKSSPVAAPPERPVAVPRRVGGVVPRFVAAILVLLVALSHLMGGMLLVNVSSAVLPVTRTSPQLLLGVGLGFVALGGLQAAAGIVLFLGRASAFAGAVGILGIAGDALAAYLFRFDLLHLCGIMVSLLVIVASWAYGSKRA